MRCVMTALAVLCVACGGGTPTSPSAPTPAPTASPSFHGTVTDTVSGASVTAYTATMNGSHVTITAPGYLSREASATAPAVDIIPDTAPFDLAFYRQLARNALDRAGAPDVLRVLSRAPAVYLQRTGLTDANVAVLEQAARTAIPALTGGRFQLMDWQTGTAVRGDADGWVSVEIVHDDAQPCGRSLIGAPAGHVWLNSAAKCNYRGNVVDPSVLAHELGHALGFGHVDRVGALMSNTTHEWGAVVVTDAERYHAAIAYKRVAGNRDVDVDP